MGKIQRFKTFEEADKAAWCFDPDATYWQRVAELWKFADHLLRRRYPKGVFRYHTIEEANKEAEHWIVSNASSRY